MDDPPFPNRRGRQGGRGRNPFLEPVTHIQSQRKGNPVKKSTKVAGKRIGGAQRAEQARQQKRRDNR